MSAYSSFISMLGAAYVSVITLLCINAGVPSSVYAPYLTPIAVFTGIYALAVDLLVQMGRTVFEIAAAVRAHRIRKNGEVIGLLSLKEESDGETA